MNASESFEHWLDDVVGPLPIAAPEDGQPAETAAQEFLVDDDDKASWALRKIARLEAAMSDREAFVAHERALLDEWKSTMDQRDTSARLFFEGLLRDYLLRLRESGALGKQKSYKLPHGILRFRSVAVAFEVTDAQEFLAWCEEEDLVEVTVKPKWAEVQARLVAPDDRPGASAFVETVAPQTGEISRAVVPGVVICRSSGESFSVKTTVERKDGAA